MTNDVLLDTDDFDDDFFNEIGKQQSEPDEQEHLNEAYDRVSSNGAMPDPAAYGFGEINDAIATINSFDELPAVLDELGYL